MSTNIDYLESDIASLERRKTFIEEELFNCGEGMSIKLYKEYTDELAEIEYDLSVLNEVLDMYSELEYPCEDL